MTGFSCRHTLAGIPCEERTIDGKAERYCPICDEENNEALGALLASGVKASDAFTIIARSNSTNGGSDE